MPSLAIVLAGPCHRIGKGLPLRWQDFANMLAKTANYNEAVRVI
ncbi:hypothetical protein [Bacteroides sp.]|nr:hypothetical protein [Bacteroides sp.]